MFIIRMRLELLVNAKFVLTKMSWDEIQAVKDCTCTTSPTRQLFIDFWCSCAVWFPGLQLCAILFNVIEHHWPRILVMCVAVYPVLCRLNSDVSIGNYNLASSTLSE